MITTIYSILHMFVDGICAFAMFGKFVNDSLGYEYFLIYNFCAFAMQMPLGAMLDLLNMKRMKNDARTCALLGVALTILGAWVHPAILGLGNALFHVGAGVNVIKEDEVKGFNGQALGVFVAPGAWGLFLGTQATKGMISGLQIFLTCILVVMLKIFTQQKKDIVFEGHFGKSKNLLLIGCFVVVILRSYVGMAVTFPWKTTAMAGTMAVLAVVYGKMAGGILAARFGVKRTIVTSLGLAAICYFLSSNVIMGILALVLFNMTMPITLYLLVKNWKELPGFSFGLLTFGLFLGFLPVYYDISIPVSSPVLGAIGSLISLAILLVGKGWCRECS